MIGPASNQIIFPTVKCIFLLDCIEKYRDLVECHSLKFFPINSFGALLMVIR